MRFAFVEEHRGRVPVERLCRIMNVASRGYRAWASRPVSQRQRDDMIILAHIREQHRLSLGSYGRSRMTEELKELGLDVGHRRVGRLMRENGISVVRTRKYKATTDSNHRFNIAPNLLDRDFTADQPNQKWAGDISYIWTREGWRCAGCEGSAFGPAHSCRHAGFTFTPGDRLGCFQPVET